MSPRWKNPGLDRAPADQAVPERIGAVLPLVFARYGLATDSSAGPEDRPAARWANAGRLLAASGGRRP